MSRHHQLLAFVSLLETNKPYLVNCVRVPALQALLLFSHSLDTSADCARLVVDGWLEITVPNADSALRLLSTALQLRSAWEKLLHQLRMRGAGVSPPQHPRILLQVPYHLHQLTGLEKQNLYIGPQTVAAAPRGDDRLSRLQLPGCDPSIPFTLCVPQTDMDLYSNCLRSFWTCPHCDLHMPFTPLERMYHESACWPSEGDEPGCPPLEEAAEHSSKTSALHRSYHCNVCQQDFTFTPTEILQHKKQHR
uniref:DHX34-like C2H2-type zinc finger domain-containing protein n=1 Tax=Buteo japonicus TaxID=224669 RepID=A0A8B9ZA43_9AVES